jgi:hypothetical protein
MLGAGSADAGEYRRQALDVNIESLTDIDWTELAEREHDGITVTLYWARSTNVLAVTVNDVSTGDYFELVLANNEPPLDVFYHPFAYARRRGVELLADTHEAEVAVDS